MQRNVGSKGPKILASLRKAILKEHTSRILRTCTGKKTQVSLSLHACQTKQLNKESFVRPSGPKVFLSLVKDTDRGGRKEKPPVEEGRETDGFDLPY